MSPTISSNSLVSLLFISIIPTVPLVFVVIKHHATQFKVIIVLWSPIPVYSTMEILK